MVIKKSLNGTVPGPWCPAYHRSKVRDLCVEKKCKYLQDQKHTLLVHNVNPGENVTSNLDAVSIKDPKVLAGKEMFDVDDEKCKLHCIKYDEPSKNYTLPWEME